MIKGISSSRNGRRHDTRSTRLRPWLKDTGATWHSTNDPRVFHSLRKPDKTYLIQYGNKVTEKAAGIGTVHIPVTDCDGKQSVLVLHDVLYLPRSSGNIFSSQYYIGTEGARTGNSYSGGSDGTYIEPRDGARIKLHEANGSAYIVPNGGEGPARRLPCNLQMTEDTSTLAYWHALLGHTNVNRILEMQREGSVEGLPSKFSDSPQDLCKCPVCLVAKSRRKSNKSRTRTPATRKFEIVSTDLVQFNARSELEGFKWAVVYVDHFTRMRWAYGVKRKSDAYITLDKFITEEVHARKHKLGTMMSDNGGEFISADYLAILAREHAEIRRSAPYTQSQNGIAERAIGSLVPMVRCMLEESKKPITWWSWALKTACYCQNRIVTRGLPKGKTPYELMEGTKPDLTTLHPFGCDLYMVIPEKQRGKLDPTARKVAFVGYPRHHSSDTYIGYDVDNRREYTSFHAYARQKDFTHGSAVDGEREQLQHRRYECDEFATDAQAHAPDGDAALAADNDTVTISDSEDGSDHNDTPTATFNESSDDKEVGDDEAHEAGGGDADVTTTPASPTFSPPQDDEPPATACYSPASASTPSPTMSRQRERNTAQAQGESSETPPRKVYDTWFRTSGHAAAADQGKREGLIEAADPDIRHPRTRSEHAAAATTAAAATADSTPISHLEAHQIVIGFNNAATSHSHACCHCMKGATSRHAMVQMNRSRQASSDIPDIRETGGLCFAAFNSLDIRIPENEKQARAGKYARQWVEAEKEEMDSMNVKNVFEEIHRDEVPVGANICDSRFVYDIKTDENGHLERFKVRWVAKGFSQRHGKDYWETFSPVVRMNTVRMLLALATQEGWDVQQTDIKTAFLEAELDEDIYVRPPPGYGKPGTVYKLKRALYGLKQSSRQWSKKFSTELKRLGFTPLKSDTCVYVRRRKGDKITVVAVYVDDCVLTGSDTEGIREVKQQLAKAFRLKDLGELRQMLGCTWRRQKDGSSTFTQTKTICDLANKFSIPLDKSVETPAIYGDKLLKEWQPKEGSDEHKRMIWAPAKRRRSTSVNIPVHEMSLQTAYRSIVGNLLWIARCTRPDIMWITSELTRFMQNPGIKHLRRAVRVVQYLLATKDVGIRWRRRSPNKSVNELVTSSDASFCDREDGKSTFGYIIYLNCGPIDWQSKSQLNVAKSTCESEYIGMSAAISTTIALAQVLDEIGFRQPTVPILCDNTAAIAISKDDCAHQRTRGIRLRYHHIRDEVDNKSVKIMYCPTEEQPSDIATKSLPAKQHIHLRRMVCSG